MHVYVDCGTSSAFWNFSSTISIFLLVREDIVQFLSSSVFLPCKWSFQSLRETTIQARRYDGYTYIVFFFFQGPETTKLEYCLRVCFVEIIFCNWLYFFFFFFFFFFNESRYRISDPFSKWKKTRKNCSNERCSVSGKRFFDTIVYAKLPS